MLIQRQNFDAKTRYYIDRRTFQYKGKMIMKDNNFY